MSSRANPQLQEFDQGYILYDAALIAQPSPDIFNPAWLARHGQVSRAGKGRGEAWFVSLDEQHWVLRHYMRGGMVARFSRCHYLGWRGKSTRAWKEWQLLHRLHDKGLPVPRPVAAHVHWQTPLRGLYQAWLLVEQIPGARTFAEVLSRAAVDDSQWQALGRCIRRFHDQNVYHADLNANNILLDSENEIFLIDFDRGDIRQHGPWKQANLARLLRSLLKLQNGQETLHFTEENWQSLLRGYDANT